MPIKAGWNILKFNKVEQAKNKAIGGIAYDAYKFYAVNLINEEVEFVFLIPTGAKPATILNDLFFCNKTQHWFDVNLVERKRVLAIQEMKEINQDQAEFALLKTKLKGSVQ